MPLICKDFSPAFTGRVAVEVLVWRLACVSETGDGAMRRHSVLDLSDVVVRYARHDERLARSRVVSWLGV